MTASFDATHDSLFDLVAEIDAEELGERMDAEPEGSCYDPDEYRETDYPERVINGR